MPSATKNLEGTYPATKSKVLFHYDHHVANYIRKHQHWPPRPKPDPVVQALSHYQQAVKQFTECSAGDHVAQVCVEEAMQRAQDALTCTVPTTLAGMQVMLEHVMQNPDHHPPEKVYAQLARALHHMLHDEHRKKTS